VHSQTRTSPAAPGEPRRLTFAPLSPGTARHLALSAAVALGLAVTLGLAACGAPGPSPMTTFPPTTPPTTTHSASPSPTAPEPEPTTATPTSRAEASWDVVEKFFDAYTYGMQTGDSSRLVPLATESCKTCANLVETIDELRSRKVVGTGGDFRYPRSVEHVSPYEDRAVWEIEFTQNAIDRSLSEPAEHFQQEEATGEMYVELTLVDGRWLVSLISRSSKEVDS